MADSLSGLGSATIWKPEEDWSQVDYDFDFVRDLLEFTGTATEVEIPTEEKPARLSFKVVNETKAQEYALLQKFAEWKGRFGRFWLMCPENFFNLKGNHTSGLTQLKVDLNLWEYRGYERIFLLLKNGDLITRQVTNMSVDEGLQEITLTINLALDRNLTPAEVKLFSQLYLCRLDNDDISVEYHNKGISECKLSFVELVKEYAGV